MAMNRAQITNWLSASASIIVSDHLDSENIDDRLSVLNDIDAAQFAFEVMDIMRVIAESVTDPAGFDALQLPASAVDATLDVAMILLCQGLCIAAPRVAWTTRPQARAARNRIRDTGELANAVVSARGAVAVDLYQWLGKLVEIAVRIVSDQAANAVPVVRIETGISLPSTVLAYRLYGDAARAAGVVEIARSGTPMVMPIAFDALES